MLHISAPPPFLTQVLEVQNFTKCYLTVLEQLSKVLLTFDFFPSIAFFPPVDWTILLDT